MKAQAQTDLARAIAEIAAVMPHARAVQLYEFALFLKSHPLPAEETFEEIAADEKIVGRTIRGNERRETGCARSLGRS